VDGHADTNLAPAANLGCGDAAYDQFARRIVDEGVVTDPWIDGQPRFCVDPIVLSAERYGALCRAAEDVAAACQATASLYVADPRLLDVLGLTPAQRAMWALSGGAWHGLARADVFFTREGISVAEINCDTPTGEAEAVTLGRLSAVDAERHDPNAHLGARFLEMLAFLARRERSPDAGPVGTVGLVYPTELSEDLSLVRLYRAWLEGEGMHVVLGSPHNLRFDGGRTLLFDEPLDVVLRHYKTDWWGERSSVWRQKNVVRAPPLDGPLQAVAAGALSGSLAVVNPFGAVALQNKRTFALMWEQIHRFPAETRRAIERYVPMTRRLEVMHEEQLLACRGDWVLKGDYGAEGDEVFVGAEVDDKTWREVLTEAVPERWIAQRYFAAERDARGESVNYGVFLVGGKAAGVYARVQAGATSSRAKSAAVLVER
jgi:glutathionylspermidine synthase